MSKKHNAKAQARQEREERQARRVVNGIFIGLIVAALLFAGFYFWWIS